MLVYNFDGKETKWNFSKYYARKGRKNKSSGHLLAENILKEIFPNSSLYEEVTLPTKPKTYADFFVPDIRLIVEVQGRQHYEYIPHFHKCKADFFRAKALDKMKVGWCELNEFKIVQLPDTETETWKTLILNSLQ